MLHLRWDVMRAAWLAALGLGFKVGCGPVAPGGATQGSTSGTGSAGSTSSGGTVATTTAGTSTSSAGPTATSETSETSGDATGTTTGTTGAPPIGPPTCEDPVPILQFDGSPSGFVRCSNGIVHRTEAVECKIPPVWDGCAMEPGAECVAHDDCGVLGYCNDYCLCSTTCSSDGDCGPEQICLCTGIGGQPSCIPGLCHSDADCDGSICAGAIQDGLCGGNVVKVGCHGPASECHVNSDCPPPSGGFIVGEPICSPEPHFTCGDGGGAGCAGRPFIVEARERTARAVEREDWIGAIERLGPIALDDSSRIQVADHWVAAGLAEHASVASFARFMLHLLAVGAPPELIAASQRALGDEIRHAQMCFALARVYGGRAVGPGPLDVRGALAEANGLLAITAAVVREACIGETLAALEVREATARAADPSLRAVLEQIADDEERHAQLGWQFLRWVIAGAEASMRASVAAQLTAAIAAAGRDDGAATGLDEAALAQHGALDRATRRELRRRGIEELVEPCARAVLALIPPPALAA